MAKVQISKKTGTRWKRDIYNIPDNFQIVKELWKEYPKPIERRTDSGHLICKYELITTEKERLEHTAQLNLLPTQPDYIRTPQGDISII